MGRWRGGGALMSAAAIAAVAVLVAAAGPASAARNGPALPPLSVAPPTSPTTTTLPAIPDVAPAYTDGKAPQELLSNAISLASLGLDDSVLVKAVAVTQAKLDSDVHAATVFARQSRDAEKRAAAARGAAASAGAQYASMAGAVKEAVVYLYTAGPASLTISPQAGTAALYAQDYAYSTMGPYGVLARRQALRQARSAALAVAEREAQVAKKAAEKSTQAMARQRQELDQLEAELASATGASAKEVAADHIRLADQAGQELLSGSSLEFAPKDPVPPPVSTTSVALTWAFAELGKEYVWGATGPDTFDCSGLTQFVWKAAGVSIPRVAADQDAWTVPVPLSELLPGDLVFFGTTDIHHVGIYIGNGLMINAPHTGTVVQVSPIWWSDLAGFGRVHYPGTPVPPHPTPSPVQPVKAVVVPAAGPVPSQTTPPAGWTPKPGETTPIELTTPGSTTTTTLPTTTIPPPSSTTTTAAPAPLLPSPPADPNPSGPQPTDSVPTDPTGGSPTTIASVDPGPTG